MTSLYKDRLLLALHVVRQQGDYLGLFSIPLLTVDQCRPPYWYNSWPPLTIPLVYDVHHHRCNPDGLSVEQVTRRAIATWNREPLFHISSPLEGWKGPKPERHHDFIDLQDFPTCWRRRKITVEVEAKAKEVAVKQLQAELQNAETLADTWFVYLLRCADGSLYTGITKNLSRRCEQHNAGTASFYTRSRLPVELVYQERKSSHSLALKREAAIKALSRLEKEALIRLEVPCL